MRHPDADTSPNASIEAHDIDIARTHHRHSFLRERHTIRSGKIAVDTSHMTLTNAKGRRTDSGYESGLATEKEATAILPENRGFTESPTSSPNSMLKAIRHSEDLVLEKTRASSDSMEMRKRGFLSRLHSLRHRPQGSRG